MPLSGEVAIGAVIAAAGLSTRMGTPKQLLLWGERSVIETVVANLDAAGASPVLCVVGHLRHEMEAVLARSPALMIYNEDYAEAEMLSSYQCGIARLTADDHYAALTGALLSLGDQPHIGADIIRQVVEAAMEMPNRIVIPSHDMRRGHPIYLPLCLWGELRSLGQDESLRVLLDKYSDDIIYVNIESDVILLDMDTPDAYEQLKPTDR